jgi:hypothetical protein
MSTIDSNLSSEQWQLSLEESSFCAIIRDNSGNMVCRIPLSSERRFHDAVLISFVPRMLRLVELCGSPEAVELLGEIRYRLGPQ